MIGLIVACIGVWFLQDALASIAFYPNERWRWNHTVRIIRAVMAVALMILGGMLI